jgi:hypothetical protein
MTRMTILDAELFDGQLTLRLTLGPGADEEAVLALVGFDRPAAPVPALPLRRDALRVAEDGVFCATLPLPPPDCPLHGISVLPASAEEEVAFTGDLERQLARLFPQGREIRTELPEHRAQHWESGRMRYFLAEQVVRFFRTSKERRISAVLVLAYEAVEIGGSAQVARARAALRTAFSWLPRLPLDIQPRRNREHREISLLSAQWHLELAAGEVEAARTTLRRVLALADSRTSYATLARSASRSLLMAGWMEWRSGDVAAALACWEAGVTMFKRAARDADPLQPALFGELTHSLEAAHVAGLCLRAIEGHAGAEMPSLERVLETAARVGVAGRRLLLANLVDHFGAEVVGPAMANEA